MEALTMTRSVLNFLTRFAATFLLMISALLVAMPVMAGSLDDFESSIPNKTESSSGHASGSDSDCEGMNADFGCFFSELVGELMMGMVVYGGQHSFERIDGAEDRFSFDGSFDGAMPLRQPGEATIPFARVDLSYHPISTDVSATSYRLEGGYAAWALVLENTAFTETNPKDSLDLNRIYGLYRMSLGDLVELDFGLGSMEVKGNASNSYLYLSTPILVHPDPLWGVEFRPAWAGGVSDYDTAFLLKHEFVGVKLGYRSISTRSESLAGFYLGVTAQY